MSRLTQDSLCPWPMGWLWDAEFPSMPTLMELTGISTLQEEVSHHLLRDLTSSIFSPTSSPHTTSFFRDIDKMDLLEVNFILLLITNLTCVY